MLVIAKVRGYFDAIREPGEKFNVPDGRKASWYTPVESQKEAKEPAPKSKKAAGEGAAGGEGEGAGKKEGEGASDPK